MEIGNRLRQIRKDKGISLRELSELSGLSVSFLGNVEKGVNSPTVSSLWRICKALDITVFQLLGPTVNERVVTRKEDRVQLISSKASKAIYEILTPGPGKKMHAICITLEPGGKYGEKAMGHPGDEFGFVVKGSLEFEAAGECYHLEEGDAVYIKEYVPHRYANEGSTVSISLWVILGEFGGPMR